MAGCLFYLMNANLVSAALSVIGEPGMLVNVVRLRVRQLSIGHRSMVETIGLGFADIALSEIIGGKLTFAAATASAALPEAIEVKVVKFPSALTRKKAA